MTVPWMILTLLTPTLLVWLLAIAGIRYLKSGAWLALFNFSALGELFEKDLLSSEFITTRLLSPANYQKVVPQIETHIDHFLRVRLKEEMPVVGMMIGDRTIGQMKAIFLKELEQLFPEVMMGYLSNLKDSRSLGALLSERLQQNNNFLIQAVAAPVLKKISLKIQLVAVGTGLLAGFLQILIHILFKP